MIYLPKYWLHIRVLSGFLVLRFGKTGLLADVVRGQRHRAVPTYQDLQHFLPGRPASADRDYAPWHGRLPDWPASREGWDLPLHGTVPGHIVHQQAGSIFRAAQAKYRVRWPETRRGLAQRTLRPITSWPRSFWQG